MVTYQSNHRATKDKDQQESGVVLAWVIRTLTAEKNKTWKKNAVHKLSYLRLKVNWCMYLMICDTRKGIKNILTCRISWCKYNKSLEVRQEARMKKPIILHWSESKDCITKLKNLKCKHKGMEPQIEDRAYSGFSFYMRCRLMVGHHPQIFPHW